MLLALLFLGAAFATPCPPTGGIPVVQDLAQALAPVAPPSQADVDAAIRAALDQETQGKYTDALTTLRNLVHATDMKDAKARYFLAQAYRLAAKNGVHEKGVDFEAMALLHLRGARDLIGDATFTDNTRWGTEARNRLRERALETPLLNQHTAGGSYPGGYCAITALRMTLRLEGIADPGADSVALTDAGDQGAPYTAGNGTAGGILDDRAQDLGLTGATFTMSGTDAQIRDSLDTGRPVMAGGEGYFYGTRSDGSVQEHTYGGSGHWMLVVGYQQDAHGNVTSYTVNDPDSGTRMSVTPEVFDGFFGGDGRTWMITYSR